MKLFHDYEFEPSNRCSSFVATAIIGAGAVGAASTIYAANKASGAQRDAANIASNTSMNMYNTTREDLSPFRDIGTRAGEELEKRLPFLTSPIELTQDWLEKTPGHTFTLSQGTKAVQNSAAKRGLGVSGAALKGAMAFATGLADQTYKTQFEVENTNRTNAYNRLKGLVDTGQNASAQTGSAGTAAANTSASAQMAAGNSQAAAYNTMGGAVNKFADNVAGYAAYKGLYGNTPNMIPSGGMQSGGVA